MEPESLEHHFKAKKTPLKLVILFTLLVLEIGWTLTCYRG